MGIGYYGMGFSCKEVKLKKKSEEKSRNFSEKCENCGKGPDKCFCNEPQNKPRGDDKK